MGTSGQPGQRHVGSQSYISCTKTMTAHANRRPHARTTDSSDSDNDHHKGICRTCADRTRRSRPSSACHRHRMDTLHRNQSSSRRHHRCQTEISAPKWPPQQTTRRRCRKPRGKDAATHAAKMSPSTGLQVVAGSETMPPRRKKT